MIQNFIMFFFYTNIMNIIKNLPLAITGLILAILSLGKIFTDFSSIFFIIGSILIFLVLLKLVLHFDTFFNAGYNDGKHFTKRFDLYKHTLHKRYAVRRNCRTRKMLPHLFKRTFPQKNGHNNQAIRQRYAIETRINIINFFQFTDYVYLL